MSSTTLSDQEATQTRMLRGSRRRRALDASRDYGIVAALAILFGVLAIASSAFLSKANLFNVIDQTGFVGIVALAGTLVVIGGGIDLSVASIFALAGIVAVNVANHSSVAVGFAAGIATGGLVGAINGGLSTLGRINSLIATLASALAIEGLCSVITGGNIVAAKPPSFQNIGNASVGGFTDLSIIFLALALVLSFIMARTVFGRWIYASGGNPDAARLAGLPVTAIKIATFVMSGLAAGLAGVLSSSRLGQGDPTSGGTMQITALTAVFVGGTSLAGGRGAVWRTLAGALLLTLIGNGFNLLGLNPTYQEIVQGVVILIAVSIDAWSRRGGIDVH